MKFDFTLPSGEKINITDAMDIHTYYEQFCTAQYIQDTYNLPDKEAMECAAAIRRAMDRYGITEADAIDYLSHKEIYYFVPKDELIDSIPDSTWELSVKDEMTEYHLSKEDAERITRRYYNNMSKKELWQRISEPTQKLLEENIRLYD